MDELTQNKLTNALGLLKNQVRAYPVEYLQTNFKDSQILIRNYFNSFTQSITTRNSIKIKGTKWNVAKAYFLEEKQATDFKAKESYRDNRTEIFIKKDRSVTKEKKDLVAVTFSTNAGTLNDPQFFRALDKSYDFHIVYNKSTVVFYGIAPDTLLLSETYNIATESYIPLSFQWRSRSYCEKCKGPGHNHMQCPFSSQQQIDHYANAIKEQKVYFPNFNKTNSRPQFNHTRSNGNTWSEMDDTNTSHLKDHQEIHPAQNQKSTCDEETPLTCNTSKEDKIQHTKNAEAFLEEVLQSVDTPADKASEANTVEQAFVLKLTKTKSKTSSRRKPIKHGSPYSSIRHAKDHRVIGTIKTKNPAEVDESRDSQNPPPPQPVQEIPPPVTKSYLEAARPKESSTEIPKDRILKRTRVQRSPENTSPVSPPPKTSRIENDTPYKPPSNTSNPPVCEDEENC